MPYITLKDGTKVLVCLKPGAKLTENDERILAEYVEYCRERKAEREAKEQRKRNSEQR